MIHTEVKSATVVLDIGTLHTFAGEAGLESPKFVSYSYVTEDHSLKKVSYKAGKQNLNSQSFNKQIFSIFDNVGVDGKVDKFHLDITKFDKWIETILIDNLQLEDYSISLLIAEDVAGDLEYGELTKQRQKIADYLLDGMELSNIAFVKKPVLSSFGLGRTTSVVLDSGHSFTHCSVVEDGFCVFNKTLKFGGCTIHSLLKQEIQRKTGKPLTIGLQNSNERFKPSDVLFHKILELENIITLMPYININSTMSNEGLNSTYTLPDGQTIKIQRSNLIDPFVNFNAFWTKYLSKGGQNLPQFLEGSFFKGTNNYRGLDSMIYESIDEYLNLLDQKNKTFVVSSSSHDFSRKRNQLSSQDLLNNVILTGGNLSFSDFGWKVGESIKKRGGKIVQHPIELNKDSNGNQCQNKNSTSWIGGSILCNLSIFNNFWIKQSQWKQQGAAIIPAKSGDPVKTTQNLEQEEIARRARKQEIISKRCP